MTVNRIFRLRYADDSAFQDMIRTQTAPCSDPDFALQVSQGDGVVLADVDELTRVARMRAIGIVRNVAGNGHAPTVEWKQIQGTLHPNAQGLRFWRQPKPFFVFAKSVIARYGLRTLFAENFAKTTPSTRARIDSVQPILQPRTAVPNSRPEDRMAVGGFVYLIGSPHGYKIGKTKRMKERSQLFSVKLPFEIEVIHYAWFSDYSQAEVTLHRRYAHKRLGGEWFALDAEEISEIKQFKLG